MCLLSVSVFYVKAQEQILERNVPRVVKEAFIAKFPDVNTVEWYKINDSVIEARFVFSRKKTLTSFNNSGTFLSSSSEIASREMPGLISNYIRGEYSEHVINTSMMSEDAQGQISYYIEISRPGVNQPITKLFFDYYGNLTRTIRPPEVAMGNDGTGINSTENDDMEYDDLEDAVSIGEPINRRELPPKITQYIEQHYAEYRFESAVFNEKEGYGMVYEVKLKRQGYRQFAELYFDLAGDFIENR